MRKIIIMATFLAASWTLTAQDDLRFGFQLSPAFSWMTANVTDINPSGTNLGLKLGMVGEYYFRENYAFSSGIGFHFNSGGTLLYDNEGNYWNTSDLPTALDTFPAGVKLKSGLQYLEIPVGLKLRTREFGYIRYYVQPAIGIGIKTQARGTIEGTSADSDEKIDISKEINPLNLSWGLGGGIEYNVSENTSIVAGLAFETGFTDATDENRNKVYFDPDRNEFRKEDSKAKVNSIIIRLGIMF